MSDFPSDQASESNLLETNASTWLEKLHTVLVVDDHALVRTAISQALRAQPEVTQVVMAQNYATAEAQATQLSPDIIYLDMHIAHSDGIAEIRRLKKLSPASRIMALADAEDEQEAFAAIMAGAQGYCSKQDVDPSELMNMAQVLCRGEIVLRPELLTCVMLRLRDAALPLSRSGTESGSRGFLSNTAWERLAQLTTREHEILRLISQGDRDRAIAKELSISEKTVQKHVQSILSKLGVQNRTQAAYLIHSKRAFEKQ